MRLFFSLIRVGLLDFGSKFKVENINNARADFSVIILTFENSDNLEHQSFKYRNRRLYVTCNQRRRNRM